MTLIERIRKDRNEARKNGSKDRCDTLAVFLAEAEKVGKDKENRESTDEEVVKIAKKLITVCQDLIQMIEQTPENPRKDELIKRWISEKVVYEEYIPQQLSESELVLIIEKIIEIKELSQPKDMGIVMSGLKSKYTGLYDGQMASDIAKKMLVQ